MIIKRVKLENYRSHSNTTVDFSKGVNLILGKNGKGKTSILEAISSVMFNTKDRSGKETGKNFIKFGEKSGKIEIEFTANDGRDYIFKTEFFKARPKKQTLTDVNGLDCEGDIQENLEELCGIKKGFEETYENIVIAKQNEFINIFKAKPKDREEIFNKIFNTQIYKEMYDSFLKEATDKYIKQIDYLSKDIDSLKENMENKEEISKLLKDEETLKEKLNMDFSKTTEISTKLSNEIKDYETTEINLKNLISNIQDEEEKLKKYSNLLKENIIEAKKAKKAKTVVEENKKSYFEYLEVEKKLKDFREIYANLLQEQKLNIQYQNNMEKLELSNKSLKADITNLEESISKNSEKKEILEKDIITLKNKEESLNSKLKEYTSLLTQLEDLEKSKKKSSDKQLEKKTEINILEKDLSSKKDLFSSIDIEEIEKQLSNFKDLEKELKSLEEQKIIFGTEVNTLKNASNELSSKICPYLKENCENLKDKEADDYFSSKISIKTEAIEDLKKKIEEKSLILAEKFAFEEKKKQYFELDKTIKNLELSLKTEEVNLKEIEVNKYSTAY